MDYVDLLIKAAEKFIQLLTVHSENKKRLFKDLVEPLYQDLESAFTDYASQLHYATAELRTWLAKISEREQHCLALEAKLHSLLAGTKPADADTLLATWQDQHLPLQKELDRLMFVARKNAQHNAVFEADLNLLRAELDANRDAIGIPLELAELIAELRARRAKLWAQRRKIYAIAFSLATRTKDPLLHQFGVAIQALFLAASAPDREQATLRSKFEIMYRRAKYTGSPHTSTLTRFIQTVEDLSMTDPNPQRLLASAEQALRLLEDRWAVVVLAYADIRTRDLS